MGRLPLPGELQDMDCMWGFAAATMEEAQVLRKAGITKPILILGYTFPYCYEELAVQNIRTAVFDIETAKRLSEAAGRVGQNIRVHIKVDTGMGRIGVPADSTGMDIMRQIQSCPHIEVEGIFTHFARADEEDQSHARKQLSLFQEFVSEAEKQGGRHIPIKHCSNSAGILTLKEANMNMVRPGIILYGLCPSDEMARHMEGQDKTQRLTPVMSLISHVVYVKELEAGCGISYGSTYVTQGKTKVATIPIGYGDGYPRGLSGRGCVLIRGQRAPILGRVCMDQFMVDVTHIEGVKAGDMVTLIGEDGEECITMEELGALSGRFNYELACDISKRVPRVYVKGGKAVSVKEYHE